MVLIRSADLWFTSVKFSYCAPGMLEIISEGIHGERTVAVTILVENKKKFRNAECKVLHKLLIYIPVIYI